MVSYKQFHAVSEVRGLKLSESRKSIRIGKSCEIVSVKVNLLNI